MTKKARPGNAVLDFVWPNRGVAGVDTASVW